VKVIVDTCVWSLALRRNIKPSGECALELRNLILDHKVQMLGPIRQEILSGIRDKNQFNKLQEYLENFPDMYPETEDYVEAARYFNLCRSKGIQGSNTDFLICAIAVRNKFSIFTIDKDFKRFAHAFPIILHRPDLIKDGDS
jgi:predicted nucleic acid-binding protein